MVEAKKEVKPPAETAADAAVKAEVKPAAPVEKEEAKAPAAKKTTARKTAAKKTEPKTAEPKAAAKKTAESKTAVKKTAAKAAEPKKETAKKAPAKKAEPKAAVHFQFDGKDIVAKDVLDQAIKAYKKAHRGVEIKDIQLYIVANEGAAYYVVNGEAADEYKILL